MPQPASENLSQEAPCKLDIIIVGCGISGLSLAYYFGKAGHRVTILEAASVLSEIGAGIILGPNVSKLLIRWGLKEKLEAIAVKAKTFSMRKYDTGDTFRSSNRENLEKEYGGPQYQIHRGDLQKLLCDLAFSFPNVNLRLNSRVVSVSPKGPSPYVVLHSGECISGDMVIGADGIKSIVRSCVVGGPDAPIPSGDALYRVIISTDAFLKDPDLRPFVEENECTVWMGQGKIFVGYCVRASKEYSIALSHPDTGDSTESWSADGNVDEMRKMFEGWDPRVQKILALVPSVLNFRLLSRDSLKSWIHSSGLVALIGDACHPMMPYRAQGAGMAIEDAAVLGYLFTCITSKSEIPALLKGYESIRLGRATEMQLTSLEAGKAMHRSDPLAQRDIAARNNPDSTPNTMANLIQDKPKPDAREVEENAIFVYDAEQAAEDWQARHQQTITKGLDVLIGEDDAK